MKVNRRKFIQSTGVLGTSVLVPGFLAQLTNCTPPPSARVAREINKLVVIQLSGGNDGLNSVIPYQNDLYYSNRPKIAIQKNKVLVASDDYGFSPQLTSLKRLYDEGLLSVINGIGYPNPDRSHFRAMDIWHTAGDANHHKNTGWIGRYLDAKCVEQFSPHEAVEMSNLLSRVMKGERGNGLALTDPFNYDKTIPELVNRRWVNETSGSVDNSNLGFLYKTAQNGYASLDYLKSLSKLYTSSADYPSTVLGNELKSVGQLINAGSTSSVYYVSHTGFDTHANQAGSIRWPLKVFNDGIDSFVKDLKSTGALDSTLILVFSEFGRRVEENASGGTDHGTANCVFLIGNQLNRAGIYNDIPDLSNLENGDLKYSIDFRQVYATILDKWLKVDSEVVLKKKFEHLSFI
ncbi:MAG: DUF1501 domain-containing protein [Cyclobacteriaceae bacterium]